MAKPILMPQLGMIMTEGTVAKWHKAAGDTVEKGEPLFEVTTDKIAQEVEATETGLLHIVAETDAVVDVGGVIGYLLEAGEAPPTAPVAAVSTAAAPAIPTLASAVASAAAPTAGAPSSPAARRLAREQGVDIAQVPGSGPGGRVVEADVLRFAATQPAAAPPMLPAREVIRLAGMRRTIAQRMSQSLASGAQFTLHTEADVTELLQRRQALFQEQKGGRISYTALLIKAAAETLKRHPRLNAHLVGEEIRVLEPVHIGFAVALDEGLLVPVLQDADKKPLAAIAQETEALAERAKAGALTLDELSGATFTVSVLGLVDGFTPIINPPEVAILGVGRVKEKPVVHSGQVLVRPMLGLSLTVDHRAVDGEPAARMLRRLEQVLESPGAWFG